MRSLLAIIFTYSTFGVSVCAQEIKPSFSVEEEYSLEVGVEVGLPIVAGLNISSAIPKSKGRIRCNFSGSLIPNLFPESKSTFSFVGAGLEYYPCTRYNGLHVGGKYSIQTFRLKEIDAKIVNVKTSFQWLQLFAGYSHRGSVFFSADVDYSIILFDLQNANEFLMETYNVEVKPTLDFIHLPTIQLGIGYRFD